MLLITNMSQLVLDEELADGLDVAGSVVEDIHASHYLQTALVFDILMPM